MTRMIRPSSGCVLRAVGKEMPKRSFVGAIADCCASAGAPMAAIRPIERAIRRGRGMHEIRHAMYARQPQDQRALEARVPLPYHDMAMPRSTPPEERGPRTGRISA